MGIIVSNWAMFGAGGLGACASFLAVLFRGRFANPYLLPGCVTAGMAAAALDYMQNGQLVGLGFGTIADLFVRVAIISAVYTGVGILAGGVLALGLQKLRGQTLSK